MSDDLRQYRIWRQQRLYSVSICAFRLDTRLVWKYSVSQKPDPLWCYQITLAIFGQRIVNEFSVFRQITGLRDLIKQKSGPEFSCVWEGFPKFLTEFLKLHLLPNMCESLAAIGRGIYEITHRKKEEHSVAQNYTVNELYNFHLFNMFVTLLAVPCLVTFHPHTPQDFWTRKAGPKKPL